MTKRPNVLLIVIDQMRGDLLGSTPLGNAAKLPSLRKFMPDATTFSQHFSVVSPCGPSRASLMTGQYAMNHRAVRNGTPLRHDTPNLATEMKTAGYEPLLFGYTDSTRDPRVMEADDIRLQTYEELMPGFTEVLRMRMETDDKAWRNHLASKGTPIAPYPECYIPNGNALNDPAVYSAGDSDTAFLTDQFLDFADHCEQGWFATLTYVRPHPPFVAPAPYNAMFDPEQMPVAETTGDDRNWHGFMGPAQDKAPPSSTVEGFPNLEGTAETTATLRAIYLGLCAEVDHHLGRVIAALKMNGQWDDTILVITSDHGEMLGDYGLWGKGTFHDAAYHVPLIIRDPAIPASHGNVFEGMTQSIDIAPTILSRVGVDVPHTMDGQSLLPLMDGSSVQRPKISFSEFDFGHPIQPTPWQTQLGINTDEANLAIFRTDRHRLIHFGCDLPPLVFEMAAKGEKVNLAEEPENAELCLDLTRQMLSHRMQNPDGTFSRTIVSGGVQVAKT